MNKNSQWFQRAQKVIEVAFDGSRARINAIADIYH